MPTFDCSENKAQEAFLLSKERFVALLGGIGSGKTASGAVKAIQKINAGEPGIIVAPDFPQLSRSTWPEFMKWCPLSSCTNAHLDHPYTNKKMIEFKIKNKTVRVYYGGIEDETGWAGPNVNWVWFDEAGRKPTRRAFDVLAGRIRIGKNPQLFITTTPAGIGNWLYEVFVKGVFPPEILKGLEDAGYKGQLVKYFNISTAANKKNLDPFYYATLAGLYGGDFAEQQLEGKFINLQGRVLKDLVVDPDVEDTNVTTSADYVPGVPIEWWVDDGFTKGHPRIILLAQVIPPFIRVFAEYHALYELAEVSIANALKLGWPKPDVAYVDSSAAELRSRLWNENIDTIKATHSVDEGIKRLSSWIRDGNGVRRLLFHPRCEYTIAEMPQYSWMSDDSGRPEKQSDNAVDCCRYGVVFKDREDIIQEGKDYRPPAVDDRRDSTGPTQPVLEPVGGLYGMYIDRLNALSPTAAR